MNKTDLIEHMAERADLSKSAAGRCLDAFMEAVSAALEKGDTVTLAGFGTFAVGTRAARSGRNPKTGETLSIKAARVPKFKPGKALRDAIG